jgi:hypothetical protein
MTKRTYLARLEPGEDGFGVVFPDLPAASLTALPWMRPMPTLTTPLAFTLKAWRRMVRPSPSPAITAI